MPYFYFYFPNPVGGKTLYFSLTRPRASSALLHFHSYNISDCIRIPNLLPVLSFVQMPLFSFSSLVILFCVLSVFTCGQHVKTKQKLLSVTRFCQTLPKTLSVHPALSHRALLLHVCGEGTCLSSAQYFTMKGRSYLMLATMYRCKVEQVASWKPLLPPCVYDQTLRWTTQKQWRPICQTAQASARCVSVRHSEHMHLHLYEQSLLAGWRWHTPGAQALCMLCCCVFIHSWLLQPADVYAHMNGFRDGATNGLFTEIPHTLMLHWNKFKAMMMRN